jgi:hypothetical protein
MRTSMNRTVLSRLGGTALFALLAVLPAACIAGDSMVEPTNDGLLPWNLRLNHKAINIAVGEEVGLTATAVDADGRAISSASLPPVEFIVTDTAVALDASGRLVGRLPRATVTVIARIHSVEGNWTIADTARVTVVQTPYDFVGFRMDLDGPLVQPANRVRNFPTVVTDASGDIVRVGANPIRPTTHYHVSAHRSEYFVQNPWASAGLARNLSTPTITAKAYIFGKVYSDSVKLQVVYPDSAILSIHRVNFNITPSPSAMSQTDLTILQGGKVAFRQLNATSPGDDIIFDDLNGVIGGHIDPVRANPGNNVVFPNLGKFTYTSTTLPDVKGTITVVPRPAELGPVPQ